MGFGGSHEGWGKVGQLMSECRWKGELPADSDNRNWKRPGGRREWPQTRGVTGNGMKKNNHEKRNFPSAQLIKKWWGNKKPYKKGNEKNRQNKKGFEWGLNGELRTHRQMGFNRGGKKTPNGGKR